MMKQEIIFALQKIITTELSALERAQEVAAKAATEEESRPENQYDTRSTEASYLAAGQAQRVEAFKKDLRLLRQFSPKKMSAQDPIQIGSFIELECDGEQLHYLLAPVGGGYKVEYEGKMIQIITPESLLGQELIDKRIGEEVEIKTRITKLYFINSVS